MPAGFFTRDLKPANIMLTEQGHVKVMDFGLAKRVEDRPSPDQETSELGGAQLTPHGAIVGTPDYMSPEQVKSDTLDVRSDLFSFGVILAEMTSGRHPFRRRSTGETLAAVLRESPDLSDDMPTGLRALAARREWCFPVEAAGVERDGARAGARRLPDREVGVFATSVSSAGRRDDHSIDCRASTGQLLGRSQPGLLR